MAACTKNGRPGFFIDIFHSSIPVLRHRKPYYTHDTAIMPILSSTKIPFLKILLFRITAYKSKKYKGSFLIFPLPMDTKICYSE